MEYVYFSRPDSDLNEVNVHTARKRMGIELAKEHPVPMQMSLQVCQIQVSLQRLVMLNNVGITI